MISIVVAARNDDYGGGFLHRFQLFVNVLLPQLDLFCRDSELVIVEWNPPDDKPPLIEAIRWPEAVSRIPVRILEVDKSLHSSLPNSKKIALFEFIAKNVGIRRTRGDFVLVTNADILFTAPLVQALGRSDFSEQCFYRIDRYDFKARISSHASPRHSIMRAKWGIHTVCFMQETTSSPASQRISIGQRVWGVWTDRWPGSHERVPVRGGKDCLVDFDTARGHYWGLHTSAAGDFILASRGNWFGIRGFAEFTDTFTHLDSYVCYQLKSSGLRQVLFVPPCMILHGDHARREQLQRPQLSQKEWLGHLESIRTGELGPAINGPGWGFGNVHIRESIPRPN